MFVKIRFTYDVVTEESAQDGDVAERGWYIPGMGKFPVEDESASEFVECTARAAVKDIESVVGAIGDVSAHGHIAAFYSADPEEDYRTGENTSYCAHIVCDPRLVRAIVKALGK